MRGSRRDGEELKGERGSSENDVLIVLMYKILKNELLGRCGNECKHGGCATITPEHHQELYY